ncbi:unnamed protein product [Clonostachys byssicola]|uniref:Heterokaryon incompatibility domain-containing protein n=1 Tax=Clonostachys byssicola TaxID=160290 RepID=A0A9N9Y2T9_9HYPO|nr:unnamed protein product [Clonostachys byssicola]
MAHLCVICRNISFQSLAKLSLKLHPTVEFGGTSHAPAKDWSTNTYYLHYPTRQQLEESKKTCHLCALLSESLHIESIARPNFLDCGPEQIFITLKSGIPHTKDPKLAEHIITVWANQDSGDVLAKVYQQGSSEPAEWSKMYDPLRPKEKNNTTGSPNMIRLAKNWLQICRDTHSCQSNDDKPPLLPTRVVDVGLKDDDAPRIHTAEPGQRHHYITLSYCWGDQRKIEFLKSLKENIVQHTRSLPTTLHATLRDALNCTRALGFRYIWIDALCIIQDDKADVGREISQMGHIYRNSSLTIGAGNGSDVTSGLFVERDSFLFRPCFLTMRLNGQEHRAYIHRFPHQYLIPLETRLWVVQEQILSQRTLVFLSDHVEWRCKEAHIPENIPSGFLSRRLGSNISDLQAVIGQSTRGDMRFPYDQWYTAVSALSARNATFLTDQLPAMAGVASLLHETFGLMDPAKYVAGLWKEDIIAGLIWLRRRALPSQRTRDDAYIAPSWSWAANPVGTVYFPTAQRWGRGPKWDLRQLEQMVAVQTINIKPENVADNPFGKVSPGGCIKITGKLREAVTLPITKEYSFEHGLRALYTGGNGSIAGVFDTGNGSEDPQIVGLVSFDSLEEREALPKIECLPILKFPSGYSSEESPCTMICLALKKVNGQYQRVGLIGLFRMHRIVEIRDGLDREDIWDYTPDDIYWDDETWDETPEKTISIF